MPCDMQRQTVKDRPIAAASSTDVKNIIKNIVSHTCKHASECTGHETAASSVLWAFHVLPPWTLLSCRRRLNMQTRVQARNDEVPGVNHQHSIATRVSFDNPHILLYISISFVNMPPIFNCVLQCKAWNKVNCFGLGGDPLAFGFTIFLAFRSDCCSATKIQIISINNYRVAHGPLTLWLSLLQSASRTVPASVAQASCIWQLASAHLSSQLRLVHDPYRTRCQWSDCSGLKKWKREPKQQVNSALRTNGPHSYSHELF